MIGKWPSFSTKDLAAGEEAEAQRRWDVYNSEMQALIAAGGVHQDDDGWWVDDATGELIGPDPSIERPLTSAGIAEARPLRDVYPELARNIENEIARRGRPRLDKPKRLVTLRLDQDVIEKFEATGKGWRSRINDVLRAAKV